MELSLLGVPLVEAAVDGVRGHPLEAAVDFVRFFFTFFAAFFASSIQTANSATLILCASVAFLLSPAAMRLTLVASAVRNLSSNFLLESSLVTERLRLSRTIVASSHRMFNLPLIISGLSERGRGTAIGRVGGEEQLLSSGGKHQLVNRV
jgi:hypothetical protein